MILKQAEVYGYRPEGSNPCTGIKRYRRRGRERFLTTDEMRRLSRILDHYRESHPLETSIVRLLLLTGCRKSEVLTLKWSEYREYASVALAHGETILTIGRLLGHNDPATTLKYTHLADAAVHEAAEALVPVLGREG